MQIKIEPPSAIPDFLLKQLEAAALRMQRKRHRSTKRFTKWFDGARVNGFNGPRAVARRLRQIERGSLREANGLVSS